MVSFSSRACGVFLAPALLVGTACPAATPEGAAAHWQAVTPGGETVCSNGTPYTFFAREASSDHLLVHLQGGGGCWFSANCDLNAQPSYDPFTDESDDPSGRDGIFDLDNEANPAAGYSMLYITYCTADVHLGDRVVPYEREDGSGAAGEFRIHHEGAVNGRAALEWAFEHFKAPKRILVTGSSAGAIASPFYAGLLADHYPDARIAVFADSGGGYRDAKVSRVLALWGVPEVVKKLDRYAAVDAATMDFETFVEVEAKHLRDSTFARYDTQADAVQLGFLELLGVRGVPLIELLDENHAELRGAVPNFRTFTAAGNSHTILSAPEFYSVEAGGVKLVDWVRNLANGAPVEDVRGGF